MDHRPSSDSNASLIAVDWGSTNFRAALIVDGEVIDRVESADGIRNRNGRDFDDLLFSLIGHWWKREPNSRILLSGMIGSREGWKEIPYVLAPAGIEEIAQGIQVIPSRHLGTVRLVPGVRWDDPKSGTTDVMRGEETQVAGIFSHLPEQDSATLCLPGTHSKWIVCRDRKIERFHTFLTGEAFERLTRDSLIAGAENSEPDPESAAFRRGVELSQSTDSGLLHHLFLGRTEMLTGRVSPTELKSLISGILIGHEIREAAPFSESPLFLLGDSPATRATAEALRLVGCEFERIREDSHLAGILALGSV